MILELLLELYNSVVIKMKNEGLQFKIIDMLDFIKSKRSVTKQEIKEW